MTARSERSNHHVGRQSFFQQSAVIVFMPTFGEALITSGRPDAERRRFRANQPAPPITTISLRERPRKTKKERFSDRGFRGPGAEQLCDRDSHVRKSRSQRTDPDPGHSRDDGGRDDGAHRDAYAPKA